MSYEEIIYEAYKKGREMGLTHEQVKKTFLLILRDCKKRFDIIP